MKNRFRLADLVRRLAPPTLKLRRTLLLKAVIASRRAEAALRRILQGLVAVGARLTRSSLLTAVRQAQAGASGTVSAELDTLRAALDAAAGSSEPEVEALIAEEAARHRARWAESVKTATGIDISERLADTDLADEVALIVRRNLGLMHALKDDVVLRVERAVTQAVLGRVSSDTLERTLAEQLGITHRRARLIARDQIAKANADLTRLRQEQAGVDAYVWSTCLDERVRGRPRPALYPSAKPSHWAREGQRFRWDAPPEGGHPGHAVNCRCLARPVLDLRG